MASISSRRQTSITRFINLEETHAGKVKTDDVLLRLWGWGVFPASRIAVKDAEISWSLWALSTCKADLQTLTLILGVLCNSNEFSDYQSPTENHQNNRSFVKRNKMNSSGLFYTWSRLAERSNYNFICVKKLLALTRIWSSSRSDLVSFSISHQRGSTVLRFALAWDLTHQEQRPFGDSIKTIVHFKIDTNNLSERGWSTLSFLLSFPGLSPG